MSDSHSNTDTEERQKQFGELLRDRSRISARDKIVSLAANLYCNAGKFILIPATIALASLVPFFWKNADYDQQIINSYVAVSQEVRGLERNLREVEEMQSRGFNNQDFSLDPSMLDTPYNLIAEHPIMPDSKDGQELLDDLDEHRYLFEPDAELEPAIEYLDDLYWDTLPPQGGIGPSIYYLLAVLAGGLGLMSALGGLIKLSELEWEDPYRRRRILGGRLEEELPRLMDNLEDNPNVEAFSDFADILLGHHGISEDRLLDILFMFSEDSDRSYGLFMETLADNPQALRSEKELELAVSGFGTMDPNARTSYIKCLKAGWTLKELFPTIEATADRDEDREFLLTVMEGSADDKELFKSIMEFYTNFESLQSEKSRAIIRHLDKRGNRQLAEQMAECNIGSDIVMAYLQDIDELPGVGTKGQIETFVRLNNLIRSLEKIEKRISISDEGSARRRVEMRLEELLQYEPHLDESMIEALKFLERHPDMAIEKVLSGLGKYYFFSQGRELKSKWIKKENQLLKEEHDPIGTEELLNKKGERKFLEELERKAELTRYEAFNRKLEQLFSMPLEEMFGSGIGDTQVQMTDDIINVVIGYHRLERRNAIQNLMRKVVKAALTDPEHINEFIACLEGNKALEEHLGKDVLDRWLIGLEQSYEINKHKDAKKLLEDEASHEFSEMLRCSALLGYTREHSARNLSSMVTGAERIYDELTKLEIPKGQHYLLEEAKSHLQNLRDGLGIITASSLAISIYTSPDPIEAMQMGVVSNSCTNITSATNDFASVVNAIDNNKQVVYMADESGKRIGRTLAVLTDKGIVTFKKYDKSSLDTDEAWVDYFASYAKNVGVPLIVPKEDTSGRVASLLKKAGARQGSLKVRLHKAVCQEWYNDYKGGRVLIPKDGYTFKVDGYILTH